MSSFKRKREPVVKTRLHKRIKSEKLDDVKENDAKQEQDVKVETDSSRDKGTVYDKYFKWNELSDNCTLLYIGAGWDMSFPIHRLNILMDCQPEIPYYERRCNGFPLEKNLKDTIHWQLKHMFPEDLKFEEDETLKRWCWSSVKRDVTIIYYHSTPFHCPPDTDRANLHKRPPPKLLSEAEKARLTKLYLEQKLPAEALKADVLWVEGWHPRGVERFLPNLKHFELGRHTVPMPQNQMPKCNTNPNTQPTPKLKVTSKRTKYFNRICDHLNALYRMQLDLALPVGK